MYKQLSYDHMGWVSKFLTYAELTLHILCALQLSHNGRAENYGIISNPNHRPKYILCLKTVSLSLPSLFVDIYCRES